MTNPTTAANIARLTDALNADDAHDNGYRVPGFHGCDHIDADTLAFIGPFDEVYLASWCDRDGWQVDEIDYREELADAIEGHDIDRLSAILTICDVRHLRPCGMVSIPEGPEVDLSDDGEWLLDDYVTPDEYAAEIIIEIAEWSVNGHGRAVA